MSNARLAEDGVEPVAPTEAEAATAANSARDLARLLRGAKELRVQVKGEGNDSVSLPPLAVRVLVDILNEMAQGNALEISPVRAELTTQQAADLLHVSRPYLIKLIREGQLPCRKVGKHRRIRRSDLLALRRRMESQRREALRALVAEAEELDMGY